MLLDQQPLIFFSAGVRAFSGLRLPTWTPTFLPEKIRELFCSGDIYASLRRGCHLERRASLQKKKSRRFFCSAGVDLSRRGYAARAAAMSEPRACPDGARSGGLTRRAAELRPATAASSMIERSSLRHPLDAFCCIILRALALTAPPTPLYYYIFRWVGGPRWAPLATLQRFGQKVRAHS